MSVLRSNRLVAGVLIDITGVLYESGSKEAIPGSIEALKRLKQSSIPFKFVTNETQNTREGLVDKLSAFGYGGLITPDDIFAPAPACREYMQKEGLHRPHLLVHPKCLPEFEGFFDLTSEEKDCVIVGDAAEEFSYENVNKAFQTLLSMKQPRLLSLGYGKYYKEKGQLVIDLGAYAKALEFATGLTAEVIGKPSQRYFQTALSLIGVPSSESVMIGDDIVSDVGAAQKYGLSGILVKTGKFRPGRDECHPEVKPDVIVDNFLSAISIILDHNARNSNS